jgi:uncharacterized protein involved in exopolysaccharide biosynthesis
MDLMTVPLRLWRWRWAILSVVVVTGLGLAFRFWTTQAKYESQVRILVTAPPTEEVSLLTTGNRSASFLRDDLTLARNNFLVVLRSDVVLSRTIKQLALEGRDARYQVVARPLRDSDFTDIVVTARTPALASDIANAHVAQAVQLYGELRAKPAAVMKDLVGGQLQIAAERLRTFEKAITAADGTILAADPVTTEDLRDARETYQLLLSKHAQASLVEGNALRTSYINVVEPATPPEGPKWSEQVGRIVGLWLVGSLVLGVLLALLLETVTTRTGISWDLVRGPAAAPHPLGRLTAGPIPDAEAEDESGHPVPGGAEGRLATAVTSGPDKADR